MPKVSVIIPAYNSSATIGRALTSVFEQTCQDFEVIVVDDGSTDNTRDIVAAFGSRVSYLYQPNRGPSAARNLGLQRSEGETLVFLDADDTLDPRFLELTLKRLDRFGDETAGICTGWCYVDADGQALAHTRFSQSGFLGFRDFLFTNPFPIHATLVRSNMVRAAGGFDEQILAMEDWDLWLRISFGGKRFFAIEDCLAHYRLNGFSNSRRADRMRAGRLSALEKLFSRKGLPQEIKTLRPQAFARALLQSSAGLYAAGCPEEGLEDFCESVHYWPDLLSEDETYYAILCADQPVGYKGTGFSLELAGSEKRMFIGIDGSLKKVPESKRWRKLAYGKAYETLGRLAYAQQNLKTAKKYFYLAFKQNRTFLFRASFGSTWVKALLGPRILSAAKKLKIRLVAFLHIPGLSSVI